MYTLQLTACLVVNPIMVGNFAFLFNCMRQGCKIPLVRSHLRVKSCAGRVKVLTTCVQLYQFTASLRKLGQEGRVTYLEILHPFAVGPTSD